MPFLPSARLSKFGGQPGDTTQFSSTRIDVPRMSRWEGRALRLVTPSRRSGIRRCRRPVESLCGCFPFDSEAEIFFRPGELRAGRTDLGAGRPAIEPLARERLGTCCRHRVAHPAEPRRYAVLGRLARLERHPDQGQDRRSYRTRHRHAAEREPSRGAPPPLSRNRTAHRWKGRVAATPDVPARGFHLLGQLPSDPTDRRLKTALAPGTGLSRESPHLHTHARRELALGRTGHLFHTGGLPPRHPPRSRLRNGRHRADRGGRTSLYGGDLLLR